MAFVELWVRPQEFGDSAGNHSQADVVYLVLGFKLCFTARWSRGSHMTDMNQQTDTE